MARTARKESEEVAEITKPDFEKALRIIKQDVAPAEENSVSERGKLSGAWKAVEKDCKANRAAAKLVWKLMNMSEELRDDFLRTQYGLMAAAHIGISADLVDAAQGAKVPTMPVVELDGTMRGFTADDVEFEAAGAGITGDALPPELQAMAEEGAKPKARKSPPKLVTVN